MKYSDCFVYTRHRATSLIGLALCILAAFLASPNARATPALQLWSGRSVAGCLGTDGVAVGASAQCDILVATNNIDGTKEAITVAPSITDPADFSLSAPCGVGTLVGGTGYLSGQSECNIAVIFHPTTSGIKTAVVSLATKYGTTSLTVKGEALGAIPSYGETRAVTCYRSDGTPMQNSYCAGQTAPATAQSCTTATGGGAVCAAGAVNTTRFVGVYFTCSGKFYCQSHTVMQATDVNGNSCGAPCGATDSCQTTLANCGANPRYAKTPTACVYYNNDGTESATKTNGLAAFGKCTYAITTSTGAQCSSCVTIYNNAYGTNAPTNWTFNGGTCPYPLP